MIEDVKKKITDIMLSAFDLFCIMIVMQIPALAVFIICKLVEPK